MIWTAKADSLLIKLWNEGRSLGLVADGMKNAGYADVTRNMVAGRKHRLQPDLFDRPRKPPTQARLPQRSTTPVTRTAFKDSIVQPEPVEEEGEGIEYLAMKDDHCKAILDRRDGAFGLPKVCGKPRTRGPEGVYSSSYCAFHLHMYHNALGQRR